MNNVIVATEAQIDELFERTAERVILPKIRLLLDELSRAQSSSPREVMTEREAAQYLGLHVNTLMRYRADRKVPYAKIGSGTIRYRRSDLDAFLDASVQGT